MHGGQAEDQRQAADSGQNSDPQFEGKLKWRSIETRPFTEKLTFVILVTILLGLSLACMAFEIYERASYRNAMASELSALADTLGANSTASLAFNDHQSALDILAVLPVEHHVVAACLYDKHGKLSPNISARAGARTAGYLHLRRKERCSHGSRRWCTGMFR